MRRPFLFILAIAVGAASADAQTTRPRARDLGIPFDGTTGPLNAITDVAGVEVDTRRSSSNDRIDPLLHATVQATEEAVINAMVGADTMTGADDVRAYALPHDRIREIMRKYNRSTLPR